MEKPNYYGILPADVRYDKNLKWAEKVLYSELTALANVKGYCYASNSYFAEFYEVHKKTIGHWISHLAELGYIKVVLILKEGSCEVEERRIYIVTESKRIKRMVENEEKKVDNSNSKEIDENREDKNVESGIKETEKEKREKTFDDEITEDDVEQLELFEEKNVPRYQKTPTLSIKTGGGYLSDDTHPVYQMIEDNNINIILQDEYYKGNIKEKNIKKEKRDKKLIFNSLEEFLDYSPDDIEEKPELFSVEELFMRK